MATRKEIDPPGDEKSGAKSDALPVIADCEGCGVCCFHMGYPAFLVPRPPMTDQEINSNPELLLEVSNDPLRRAELKAGHPGEPYWHSLPEGLRKQWQEYVDAYQLPKYGEDPQTFDGPCLWFDMETRHCKHHEHRPRICRDFETGSSECYEWRAYYSDKIIPNGPNVN
ncbi:MAG: YkgJ family cysteine cluster protein [Mariniblastus sp.]|nr:YkgJ family cysteine cluster protein [Mariniblastus sp.]